MKRQTGTGPSEVPQSVCTRQRMWLQVCSSASSSCPCHFLFQALLLEGVSHGGQPLFRSFSRTGGGHRLQPQLLINAEKWKPMSSPGVWEPKAGTWCPRSLSQAGSGQDLPLGCSSGSRVWCERQEKPKWEVDWLLLIERDLVNYKTRDGSRESMAKQESLR